MIEIIKPMTKDEAELWQSDIISTGQRLGQLLYEGYKRDAWRVLGYGSWTECVTLLAEKSGFSRGRGFQLLENERLKQEVLTNVSGQSLVTNVTEFQTRPLSQLPTDNEKREVFQQAIETAPNGKITAKHVEETVKTYLEFGQEKDKKDESLPLLKQEKARDYITLDEWSSMDTVEKCDTLQVEGNSTFNKTNDNIEWARWSWNPVTGCLHNCAYCYARDIAARFFPQNFEPSFLPARLNAPDNTKQPDFDKINDSVEKMGQHNVFVCSMADLFGKWVPAEWIEAVLDSIRRNPQWTFLLLSKFPVRMAEFSYPNNVWLGTSCDYQYTVNRAESAFTKIKQSGFNGVCWLSCEPLMEDLQFTTLEMFDWVVMGGASRSTQTDEFAPSFDWIVNLYNQAKKAGCKIYQKTNLIPGMSNDQRVREYP